MDDTGRVIGRRQADRQTLQATARALQVAAALAWDLGRCQEGFSRLAMLCTTSASA